MDELNREKVCTQNEKSVQIKKRGAPAGNKNAAGHGAPKGNRNSVGYGAPKGNRNAVGNMGGARPGNTNAKKGKRELEIAFGFLMGEGKGKINLVV